jgi:hypothetical protein
MTIKKFTDDEFLALSFGKYRKLLKYDSRTTQKQKRILKTILSNEKDNRTNSGFNI